MASGSGYGFKMKYEATAQPAPFSVNKNVPFESWTSRKEFLQARKKCTSGFGACLAGQDRSTISSRFDTLKGDVQMCAIRCILSGTDCVQSCVENLGFTKHCASCWVDLASCTRNSCILSCLNPSSQTCADCAFKECFSKLEKCSGIDAKDLPPP